VTQEIAILSPEKTLLTYRLAGPGARMMAHMLDVLLIFAFIFMISMAGSATLGVIDPALLSGVILVISSVLPFAYFIVLEGLWNGQTIGKKAMSLRVRMADGTPITFQAAVGRNFVRVADFFPPPYFAGLLAIFTSPKAQRLGDMVANTIVVHERRGVPSFTTAPHQVGVHPLEKYVGELRGMTLEEYQTLRRLADRFPELSASIQERMIREVWRPIALRRSVPEVMNVHPVYLIEATVMKYGREKGLL
jgi:uncharacterized RDD family membrane protein YckC